MKNSLKMNRQENISSIIQYMGSLALSTMFFILRRDFDVPLLGILIVC